MAQTFTIHKVTASFDYGANGVNDGVYFEKVTASGAGADWFYLKVTDLAPTVDVKNLSIYSAPGGETTNHEVAGIYFSDLTSGWNTSTMKAQMVGRFDDGPYDGSPGLGRSMVMSDDFVISWNGTVGAYVIDVAGVGTGVTSIIAQTNESNSLLQVSSSSDGDGGTAGWSTSTTVDATNYYLDVRIAPVQSRYAILGDRDTGAADDVPTERAIQAGSVKATIGAAEGGDVLFDGYTYTEGAVNDYISVIAVDSRTSGSDEWGKQFFLDPVYFDVDTQTPTGGATADFITLKNTIVMTNLAIDADSGGPSAVSPSETLRTLTDYSTTQVFTTSISSSGGNEDFIISADDPGADRVVIWNDATGRLEYASYATTQMTFDVIGDSTGVGGSNAASVAQTISDGNTLTIGAHTSTNLVLEFVSGATDTVRIAAVDPQAAADRLIFWDDSLSELNYLSIGSGLSLTGTTLTATGAAQDGTLDMAVAAGATNTTVVWDVGTGFSADTASNLTYTLDVGPALTNLATVMTSGTVGLLKKTAQDTYTIDTTSYMVSFDVSADSGSFTMGNGDEVAFVGGDAITTTASGGDTVTIDLNYSTSDFEVVGDMLQLKDKYVTDWKESCRVLTTSASTLGTGYTYDPIGGTSLRGEISFSSGPATIDGVTLANGDRILNTESGAASGIWERISANSWERARDFDEDDEVTSGATTSIEEGTTYADRVYQLITNDPIQIGGVGGTTLSWTAIAKTAFFGVGVGLVLDASQNEVTFATTNSGTTEVTVNTAYDGIMYRQNRIEAAVDDTTIQINNELIEARWATADW